MPLDAAGTLFILALHGTTPVCEDWTVAPALMTHADARIEYHMDHDDLVMDAMYRGESSSSCGAKLHVTERPDGYDVDGARWFRTRAACQAAVAHHARVAMQWPCDVDDDMFADPAPATRRRFDDVLAYGAIMYSEGECNRVRFEGTKVSATSIEGAMSYAIVADGVHGIEEYTYQGKRGDRELWLLGPGAVMEDGSMWGMGCAEQAFISYAADHVSVVGNLYFERASCKAASERASYRDSWWPNPPDEAGIGKKPLAGGC